MGSEPDLHMVPGILPCRVVILLFGQQGYVRHKGECFSEILKFKAAVQHIVFLFPGHGAYFKNARPAESRLGVINVQMQQSFLPAFEAIKLVVFLLPGETESLRFVSALS